MELTLPRAAERRSGLQRGRRETLGLMLLALPMLLFLGLPLLALVFRLRPLSLVESLSNAAVAQALYLSLTTTALSTVVAVVFGTPLAYLLARRDFRGRAIVDTLVDLPMVLPPSVAGIALLIAFGRRGLVGGYLDTIGLSLAFSQTAVVMAQVFVAAPFFIKAAVSGFAGVDRDLEQAAAIDGAGSWRIFRHITTPLAWTVLLGGMMMTWARALGEFGATIIFAGNLPGRTQNMPLAIYLGYELNLNVALTLSVILMATSFLVLFVVKRLLRQRLGVV